VICFLFLQNYVSKIELSILPFVIQEFSKTFYKKENPALQQGYLYLLIQ